jgi:heme a synthase
MKHELRSSRPVAIWLLAGVAMIIVQIILGGITRLTGSGLSITEWEVITGTLPPLNQQDWLLEFEKYKQTPQFRLLNYDFTLPDFKFIYFWEWFHRLWGRLIGIVFIIPFIIFLLQKRFTKEMIWPLVILFLLGALQGVIGWIMVASGLSGDAIYVKPTRLALHFIFAMILLMYTFWVALKLLVHPNEITVSKKLNSFTWVIIIVLFIQLIFGALMAGLRAAPAAPTWPDINGSFIPAAVFSRIEGWRSFIEDRIVIHFVHRMLAYLLTIMVIAWTFQSFNIKERIFAATRFLPLSLVIIQVALGVFTVLTSINIRPARWNEFEWMAQLHQFVALLLLLSITLAAFLVRNKSLQTSSTT